MQITLGHPTVAIDRVVNGEIMLMALRVAEWNTFIIIICAWKQLPRIL